MAAVKRQRGFTLIEVIMVVILIGIIAGVLAPFITQAISAYTDTRSRTELIAKGRLALERLKRELQHAVPNSLEVFTDGIQFLSTRAGGRFVATDDDYGTAFSNPARRFSTGAARPQLYKLGTALVAGGSDYLVIGNTSPAELKTGSTIAQVSAVDSTTVADDGTDQGQILRFSNHAFPNDSPGRHFQIASTNHEIGLIGSSLHWHREDGITDYDNDGDWSSADPILADGVTAVTFTYTPGTPESSAVLQVDMQLSDGAETIRLYHEIHIKNTP